MANATMFVRVLVVVAIIAQDLALRLAWSIGAMAVGAASALSGLAVAVLM